MKRSSVRPSVCPIDRQQQQQAPRSLGQRHVDGRRRRLSVGLLTPLHTSRHFIEVFDAVEKVGHISRRS